MNDDIQELLDFGLKLMFFGLAHWSGSNSGICQIKSRDLNAARRLEKGRTPPKCGWKVRKRLEWISNALRFLESEPFFVAFERKFAWILLTWELDLL